MRPLVAGLSMNYDKLFEIADTCKRSFKGAEKKGSGFVFVTVDRWNRPRVEHVVADDVVVDELETRYGGAPRQAHRRKSNVSKETLKAEFPAMADAIERASSPRGRDTTRRGGYLLSRPQECVEIESWFLPIGRRDAKGYRPGRHVRCVDGADLLDEPYHKPHFPFDKADWEAREGAFFGISLIERCVGIQRIITKRHWQIDRQLDQLANPTTYVRFIDANLAVKTTNELGTIAAVKGDYPQTVTPSPVSAQTFQHLDMMSGKMYQVPGVSQMAARGAKPAGLDSGEALREYRDQSSARFAPQDEEYERHILRVIWLLIDVCKDLGAAAPPVLERTKFGDREIKWAEVDMDDLKIQLVAASTLSATESGRKQSVLDWAQAGIITQDEARRLIRHPDLERAMSLYTAAVENAEFCLEEIADGKVIVPEPFMNAAACVWRGQAQYLAWRTMKRVPEEVLEALRQFIVIAAWMVAQKAAPDVAAMGAGAGAMPGPGLPPLPAGPPMETPPQAALSPQAMQLRSA